MASAPHRRGATYGKRRRTESETHSIFGAKSSSSSSGISSRLLSETVTAALKRAAYAAHAPPRARPKGPGDDKLPWEMDSEEEEGADGAKYDAGGDGSSCSATTTFMARKKEEEEEEEEEEEGENVSAGSTADRPPSPTIAELIKPPPMFAIFGMVARRKDKEGQSSSKYEKI